MTDSVKTVESLASPEQNRFRLTAVESEAVVTELITECRETGREPAAKWEADREI